MFIFSLEGGEATGKTTVSKKVKYILESVFERRPYLTREPGGNTIAEKIRDILQDPENVNLKPRTEALLYAASRNQLTEETLESLYESQYDLILYDRYKDSSLVYQGIVTELDVNYVNELNNFVDPDITFILRVSGSTAMKRLDNGREELSRYDSKDENFHNTIDAAYGVLPDLFPHRNYVTIDTENVSIDDIAMKIAHEIDVYLMKNGGRK